MRKRIFITIMFGAYLCVLFSTVCCNRTNDTVRFGVIVSTTGPASPYGIDNQRGLKIALQMVNESGGIRGKKVELDIQDSGGDPAQAVLLARRFASNSSISLILGPTRTGESVAVSKILTQMAIPMISIGSTGDWKRAAGTGFNDWTFRSTRVDSGLILPLLTVARDKFGVKTVAIIYAANDDWSMSVLGVYHEAIGKLGLQVLAEENIPVGETNRSAQLTKIKHINSDALIINTLSSDAPSIAGQARQLGYKGRFIGTAGFTNPATFSLAGENQLDGTLLAENYFADSPRAIVKEFVRRYELQFHVSAPPYAAYAADGLFVAVDAVKRSDPRDRNMVREAVGKTSNLDGLLGTITYQGPGDAQKATLILEIQGIKYVLVQ